MTIIVSERMSIAIANIENMVLPKHLHTYELEFLDNVIICMENINKGFTENIDEQSEKNSSIVNATIKLLNKFIFNYSPMTKRIQPLTVVISSQTLTSNYQYDKLWTIFNTLSPSSSKTLVDYSENLEAQIQIIYNTIVNMNFQNILESLEFIKEFEEPQYPSIHIFTQCFISNYFLCEMTIDEEFEKYKSPTEESTLKLRVQSANYEESQKTSRISSAQLFIQKENKRQQSAKLYINSNDKITKYDYAVEQQTFMKEVAEYLNKNYNCFINEFYDEVRELKRTEYYINNLEENEVSNESFHTFAVSDKLFLSKYCQHSLKELLEKEFSVTDASNDASISFLTLISVFMNLLQISHELTGLFNIEEAFNTIHEINQEENNYEMYEEEENEYGEDEDEMEPEVDEQEEQFENKNYYSPVQISEPPALNIVNDNELEDFEEPENTLDLDLIRVELRKLYLERDIKLKYDELIDNDIREYFKKEHNEIKQVSSEVARSNQLFHNLQDDENNEETNLLVDQTSLHYELKKELEEFVQLEEEGEVDYFKRLYIIANNVDLKELECIFKEVGNEIANEQNEHIYNEDEVKELIDELKSELNNQNNLLEKPFLSKHSVLFRLMVTFQEMFNMEGGGLEKELHFEENENEQSDENSPKFNFSETFVQLKKINTDLLKLKYNFTLFEVSLINYKIYHQLIEALERNKNVIKTLLNNKLDAITQFNDEINNTDYLLQLTYFGTQRQNNNIRLLGDYLNIENLTQLSILNCPADLTEIITLLFSIYYEFYKNKIKPCHGDSVDLFTQNYSQTMLRTIREVDEMPASQYEFFNVTTQEELQKCRLFVSQFGFYDLASKKQLIDTEYQPFAQKVDYRSDAGDVFYELQSGFAE